MQNAERFSITNKNLWRENSSPKIFAAGFLAFCVLAAIFIGSFPLTASIATIFLFAGVHNFVEFRYFLARMPLVWGKSKIYYSIGILGVVILTAAYLLIYFAYGWLWSGATAAIIAASWNTFFVLWVALLLYLRGRQKPKTDWIWAFPAGLSVSALAWFAPHVFALGLLYLHPFIALWFCERQIRRSKPEWLRSFHLCFALIPALLILLWILLLNSPHLPQNDYLSWRISQHAGSEILPAISSHLLVASHVFLETIHYIVWIFLIPLADKNASPFRLKTIPLFSSKNGFPRLVAGAVAVSFLAVVALWIGFSADYAATRDIYFAFAIAHVLAEFPFLIKML